MYLYLFLLHHLFINFILHHDVADRYHYPLGDPLFRGDLMKVRHVEGSKNIPSAVIIWAFGNVNGRARYIILLFLWGGSASGRIYLARANLMTKSSVYGRAKYTYRTEASLHKSLR